jgi:hypothetical protein
MPLGTETQTNYKLRQLSDCYIKIPDFVGLRIFDIPILAGSYIIYMYTLPEISDQRDVQYGEQNGIGRSMPLKTFGQGGARIINWTATFVADTEERARSNLQRFRVLAACTYPRKQIPGISYAPPYLLKLKCGKLLSGNISGSSNNSEDSGELCAILKSYNVKWPKDVPWQEYLPDTREVSYIPYKFDVSLVFETVYSSTNMPGAERIISNGG